MEFLVSVNITLKTAINDPQGLVVLAGLHGLGFNSVSKVRMGKYIEIWVEGTDRASVGKDIEEMCQQLLSNPLVEEYHYHLLGTPEGTP